MLVVNESWKPFQLILNLVCVKNHEGLTRITRDQKLPFHLPSCFNLCLLSLVLPPDTTMKNVSPSSRWSACRYRKATARYPPKAYSSPGLNKHSAFSFSSQYKCSDHLGSPPLNLLQFYWCLSSWRGTKLDAVFWMQSNACRIEGDITTLNLLAKLLFCFRS